MQNFGLDTACLHPTRTHGAPPGAGQLCCQSRLAVEVSLRDLGPSRLPVGLLQLLPSPESPDAHWRTTCFQGPPFHLSGPSDGSRRTCDPKDQLEWISQFAPIKSQTHILVVFLWAVPSGRSLGRPQPFCSCE